MEFEKALRFMRKRSGLSQEELAPRMFMSRANLSKVERGEVSMRAQDFLRWARETNSQDVVIALTCSVDISVAADIVANLTDVANVGLALLGGILF